MRVCPSVRACAIVLVLVLVPSENHELRTHTHIHDIRVRIRGCGCGSARERARRCALALLPPTLSSQLNITTHAAATQNVVNLLSHSHVSRHGTRCSGHISVFGPIAAMTNDEISPSSFWRDTNTRPFTAHTESPPPDQSRAGLAAALHWQLRNRTHRPR